MPSIIVRDQQTNEIVHTIDVTGKSKKDIDRLERGLAINFDFERYMFGLDE